MNTHLTKLTLNNRNRYAMDDISDCNKMHRTIMHAFPSLDDISAIREHYSVLYRIENIAGRIVVIVQSNTEPDWSFLKEGYLLNIETKDITSLIKGIRTKSQVRFKLKANVVKRSHSDGKRVFLSDEKEQSEWLDLKGHEFGFNVAKGNDGYELLYVMPNKRIYGHKKDMTIMVDTATYEGVIRVTDANKFMQALRNGIGRGKAYGCGMLSVMNINQ